MYFFRNKKLITFAAVVGARPHVEGSLMLVPLLQRIEARRPAVFLSCRRLAVLLSLAYPGVFQIDHPLVDVADVRDDVWVLFLRVSSDLRMTSSYTSRTCDVGT